MESNQPQENRRLTRRQAVSLIFAAVGLILLIAGLWMMRSPEEPVREAGVDLSSLSVADEEERWSISQVRQDYPVGKLVVTTDREEYENGSMRLVIPALNQDVPVQSSADTQALRSGPGLYEYAQLPAPDTNANVSIAGHRDIEGAEFYYIDTLTDGDLMYLVYEEKVYWTPITCKEYPCLTLTSCDPIGTYINRIVVTARLVDVRESGDQLVFAARMDADVSASQAE